MIFKRGHIAKPQNSMNGGGGGIFKVGMCGHFCRLEGPFSLGIIYVAFVALLRYVYRYLKKSFNKVAEKCSRGN